MWPRLTLSLGLPSLLPLVTDLVVSASRDDTRLGGNHCWRTVDGGYAGKNRDQIDI